MKKHILTFLALIVLFSTSCKKDSVTGNGNTVTIERSLSTFNKVDISGSSLIKIIKSNTYKVEITGSENLVNRYKSTIKSNEKLHLGFDRTNVTNDDLIVKIYCPSITEINSNGSGDVYIDANVGSSNEITASSNGTGNFNWNGLSNTNKLIISLNGSGDFRFEQLKAKSCKIKLIGSGNIKTHVEDNLQAEINGSGNIYYKGNPIITSKLTGTGSVVPF